MLLNNKFYAYHKYSSILSNKRIDAMRSFITYDQDMFVLIMFKYLVIIRNSKIKRCKKRVENRSQYTREVQKLTNGEIAIRRTECPGHNFYKNFVDIIYSFKLDFLISVIYLLRQYI